MFAAMSKDDVDSYNYKMMVFSAVFLGASWYLTILGSVGFVIANCLNMLLRIYHRYRIKKQLIIAHPLGKASIHLAYTRDIVPLAFALFFFLLVVEIVLYLT